MAGKTDDDDGDEEGQGVRWRVTDGSSEAEVHLATNVLRPDRFRVWQTSQASEEAWLVLEPRPATAFRAVEIVNAGSALVELYGLRDGAEVDEYELLLSPQQVMTMKDLMSQANRNRALVYDIDVNHKLSPVAAQQRVFKIKSRNQSSVRKRTEGKTMPNVQKVMKEEAVVGLRTKKEPTIEKVVKPKLVIGLEGAATVLQKHALRLDCSSLPRKASQTKCANRSPVRKETVANRKPKIEKDIEEQVVVGLHSMKCSVDAQPSPSPQDRFREVPGASLRNSKIGKTEHVDIGVNAAQEVGTLEYSKRRGVAGQAPPHTKAHPADESEKGLTGSRPKKTTARDGFGKVLEGVVFAISGIQNPARGLFRTQGLEMGAQYRPDWTSDCTVLVCAFMKTPKFYQVKADGGTIVSKDWMSECHKQRKLVSIERFLMNKGRPWRLPVYKANCGSLEEVQEWVYDDLVSTSIWLQQRDPKPKPEELEFTAAQGIMVCFEDTLKCIQNNQGVKSIVDSWECLPQAIKKLAAMEEGREGYLKGTQSIMLAEVERMKHVYSDILKHIFIACSKNPPSALKRK